MKVILPLLLCCLQGFARGYEFHVSDAADLISLSNIVNAGSGYNLDAVFLDADIDLSSDLSEKFGPVGDGNRGSFRGTFYGQGHVISGLSINSSFCVVGLFGYADGATVRNTVLDASCSVMSHYEDTDEAYVGGLIGYCYACSVEDSVNMASVAFTAGSVVTLSLGGVLGKVYLNGQKIFVRNCVNYGSITYSMTASEGTYVGGIAGLLESSENYLVQNCLNYGTLTHDAAATYTAYIGGIIGHSSNTGVILENCLSAGKIVSSSATSNPVVGSVIGHSAPDKTTSITHSYWTKDVGNFNVSGDEIPSADPDASLASLNTTTVDNLNSYNSTWSEWLMLHLNGGKINNLNQESLVVTQKHFPEPAKESNAFLFWCLDVNCNEKYDPEAVGMSNVTELYAAWEVVVLTFDFGNGTVVNETFNYNDTIDCLDTPVKEGYTFVGWSPKLDVMPAQDTTITAQWTINNYTLTFDFGNGTVTNETLNYNDTITYPENMVREGYTFVGWYIDSAFTTLFTETTITESVTLYAKFENKPDFSDNEKDTSGGRAGLASLSMLLALVLFLM